MLIRGLRGGRGRAGWMDHCVNLHTGGVLCFLTHVHMARYLMETMWWSYLMTTGSACLFIPPIVPNVVKMHHAL